MRKKTRLTIAAISTVFALSTVPAVAVFAPTVHSEGCDGECPPSEPSFNPVGGAGGNGGSVGDSQGFQQGNGQGQDAGTTSGPVIGAGGTTFSATPVAVPAVAGGTVVLTRSHINQATGSRTTIKARNRNRAGSANGGAGGTASNRP